MQWRLRMSFHRIRYHPVDRLDQLGSLCFGQSIKLESPGAWHPRPHDLVDTVLRLDRYPDHHTPSGNTFPLLKAAMQHILLHGGGARHEMAPQLTGEHG